MPAAVVIKTGFPIHSMLSRFASHRIGQRRAKRKAEEILFLHYKCNSFALHLGGYQIDWKRAMANARIRRYKQVEKWHRMGGNQIILHVVKVQ